MNDQEGSGVRDLPPEEAKSLRPGAEHYRAYVGPPRQYDFMGATQFRLLTALGLREDHRVLDFGCGSLRAGRLLIPYLLPGRYFGIEPNRWLIEDAVRRDIGEDQVRLKRPTFRHNDDFSVAGFGEPFDFIVAQSIFSHTGPGLIGTALAGFRAALAGDGLMLATFLHPEQHPSREEFAGEGWIYPGVVAYWPDTIMRLVAEAGLSGVALPWFHPRQTWYAMALSPEHLPRAGEPHLSGAVLRDPEFRASL